jgi:hypothetical protein
MPIPTNSERPTANKTSAPIEPGESGSILPEFGRVPDIERIYGLKRGLCYQLIAGGQIKSVCIRKPGAKTGVRLVHLASVREFLNSHMEGAAA